MTTVIYITSLEQASGKSLVALGMMEAAAARVSRVGYFRPVVAAGETHDPMIEMIRDRYKLSQSYEESYGVTTEQTRGMGENVRSALVHQILARFEALQSHCELVVVDGTDFRGASAAFEFALNAEIAANLGASAIVVARGHWHRVEQVTGALSAAKASLEEHHVRVIGFVVNRIDPEQCEPLRALASAFTEIPVWLLPEEPLISQPSLADVRAALPTEVLWGSPEALNRSMSGVIVGAMTLAHVMDHVRPDVLVVAPGDRDDVILMALSANFSKGLPSVAGLLLTGGYRPHRSIMKYAEGLGDHGLPMLLSEEDTYNVVDVVSSVSGKLTSGDSRKVDMALRIFEDNISIDQIEERLSAIASDVVTPVMFERQLIARARSDKRSIVLPEGNDDRVLIAADRLMRRNVVDLIVLGDEKEIAKSAERLGLDLSGVQTMNPDTSPLREELAQELVRIRAHKGMSFDTAWDIVGDVSWFGTLLVETGRVGGMVSGAAHTTADTVRPALQVIKTAEGVSIVSSAFLMALPDRVLVFADCAVVPDPNATELADIAISSAQTARAFGIDPRVAMLSYSTGSSGSGADVQKVAEATKLVQERRPDLLVEGPIQYDAAVDPGVGAKKLPGSKVAGRATVLIFPDLNTGNNTYKAVQRSAGALAIGPILQGLRLPVNDLSRGATVDDIVNTVVITAIQVQQVDGR